MCSTVAGFAIAGSCLGSVTGFVSKQLFCYYFLEPIKDRLSELITEIASSRIGDFAGRIVGHELAMVFSVPVTIYFSDLVYCAVKVTVEAIVDIVRRIFFPSAEPELVETCLCKVMFVVKKIVSFVTFFMARAYFCHYGMPLVKTVTELALRNIIVLPACMPAVSVGYVAAAIAIIAAPQITFFLSDSVGFAAAEASSFLIDQTVYMLGGRYTS